MAGLFGEIESELSGGKSAKVPEVGDPFPGHARVKGVPDSLRRKFRWKSRRWLGECLGRTKSYENVLAMRWRSGPLSVVKCSLTEDDCNLSRVKSSASLVPGKKDTFGHSHTISLVRSSMEKISKNLPNHSSH